MKYIITLLVFSFCCCFCIAQEKVDYYNIPIKNNKTQNLQAVIEIPAGTNKKIEYNPKYNRFECDSVNGKERIVQFLPYVGNYGFIPSTLMDKTKGGDGDALDVLVLSPSQPMKTIIEIIPIANLKLIDNEEKDDKIIAIPANTNLQTVQQLTPEIKQIIELWFLNYKGKNNTMVAGWGNQEETLKIIEMWKK